MNRDTLKNIIKNLVILLGSIFILFIILSFFRIGLVFWFYEKIFDWVSMRLGFDYYLALFVSISTTVLFWASFPYLAWTFLVGRKVYISSIIMIVITGLMCLFIYTIGTDVKFSRIDGEPLKWYADTPAGRFESNSQGFDPKYGIRLKQYTNAIALKEANDKLLKEDEERKRIEKEVQEKALKENEEKERREKENQEKKLKESEERERLEKEAQRQADSIERARLEAEEQKKVTLERQWEQDEEERKAALERQRQQSAREMQPSQVVIKISNQNCVPIDFYMGNQRVAIVQANAYQDMLVGVGTYTTRACDHNTSNCIQYKTITINEPWTYTVYRNPACNYRNVYRNNLLMPQLIPQFRILRWR